MAFTKKPKFCSVTAKTSEENPEKDEKQETSIKNEGNVANDTNSPSNESTGSAEPNEKPTAPNTAALDGASPSHSGAVPIRTRHSTVATDSDYSFIEDYNLEEYELDEYFDQDDDQEFIENTIMDTNGEEEPEEQDETVQMVPDL